MRDYVLVKFGVEKLFIEKATTLGFNELVLCYNVLESKKIDLTHKKQLVESTGLKLYFAIVKEKNSPKSLNSPFDMLIGLGTSLNSVSEGIKYLLNNEFGKEKDAIHQRRSGLNHVILAKCNEKNIEILTSVNSYLELDVDEKVVVMGRMKQNLKACRRADVKYNLVSFADDAKKMISKNDLNSLRQTIEQTL